MSQGFAKRLDISPVIDHGLLLGLADDDHPQYILHSLATAVNDFLIASGAGTYVKKTLAETKTILGVGAADSPVFAGLTLTGLTGILKATAGVVSVAVAGTDYLNHSGLAKITVSAVEPVGPAVGDLWIDTTV